MSKSSKSTQTTPTTTTAPDPTTWINESVTITVPVSTGDESIIPFVLWPAQRDALQALLDHSRVIYLKARQLGISWLVVAYCVWLCVFHPHKIVLIVSRDLDSAKMMVRRARGIYIRLKAKPVALSIDNTQELQWANGSGIKSIAAGEDSGSSYSASVIVLDEFAKMRFADEVYTAVMPTINDGGQAIILSTAKGKSGRFAKIWHEAVASINGFFAVFIPWDARPGRDATWYADVARSSASMAAHRQEYPSSPDDAFQDLSPERFIQDMAWWSALRDDTLPPPTKNEPMVIALDAAVSNDSFGLVAVTRDPRNPATDVAVRFAYEWKPQGRQIDFNQPMQVVRALAKDYDVAMLTADPYQLHYFLQLIRDSPDIDVAISEFPQGGARLESDQQLRSLIMQRRLHYAGAQDSLTNHIDNADSQVDKDTRRLRIVKRHESGKIDLAVALSMATYKCLKLSI